MVAVNGTSSFLFKVGVFVDDFDIVVLDMLLLLVFVGFACDVLGMDVNLMQHRLPHLKTLGQTCKHLCHCCKQKARLHLKTWPINT